MPRTIQSQVHRPRHLAFALIMIIGVGCLVWPDQYLSRLLPSASAANTSSSETNLGAQAAAVSPGSVSFTAQDYSVNEAGGTASITLTRTDGADGPVVAKVTLADITTSPTDYRLVPGGLDETFNPSVSPDGGVLGIALQADGKIIIGGTFTNYNGTPRHGIARLNADGSLDASFNPGTGTTYSTAGVIAEVHKVIVQPDGKIIVVGQFTHYNGISRNNIARLNTDGSLDTSFDPGTGANSSVVSVVLQPDGKIIIASGSITSYNGTPRNRIARVNSNGSLDTTFNPGAVIINSVDALALQADGKVLVGGFFGISGNSSIKNIARFNLDGSLDTSFNSGNSGINGYVVAIAIQPDGRVIVGGYFDIYNGSSRNRIARLHSDGSLDTAFNSYANNVVDAIILQPDSKIIIGGGFDLYNNTWRGRIARLNPDSSVDWTFNTLYSADNRVMALAMQPDGKIILGGGFSIYENVSRIRLARTTNDLFVTWPAGDTSNKTVQIPIVDDTLDEGSETLTLAVTPISGDASIGAQPTAVLTINDNDVTISSVSGTGTFGETATLTAKVISAGIALSGKSVSFTLNGNAVGSSTTDSNGFATVTGISLSGANAGTYSNAVGASFTGDANFSSKSKTGTLIVNKAAATVILSNLSHTYDGTLKVPIANTTPAGKNVVFSYSRNGLSLPYALNAGSYAVSANINDANYQGTTIATLTIDKAQASITLSSLSQTYDGTVKRAVATTNPSGLSGVFISYSQNGVPVGSTINAGSYNVTASLNNTNYQETNTTGILVINKATPVITWNNPSDIIFGTPLSSVQLNATANVSGTFQYSPPAGTVLAVGTHQLSATFTPTNALNFNSGTQSVQLVVLPPPLQLILDDSDPDLLDQAAAVDSLLFLGGPFPVVNEANWWSQGTDQNTRVMIFVSNLQLESGEPSSSVVVTLTDGNSQSYDVAAEDVRIVPGFSFTQVTFRLPDALALGTCTIKVKANGQESNAGTIRIKS